MSFAITLGMVLALFFSWLFASAGLSKLVPANRDYYENVMQNYGLASGLVSPVRTGVALLELVIAVMLILPVIPGVQAFGSQSLGFLLAGFLLVAYALLIANSLWQGKRDMDCGCAGSGRSVKIGPELLWRNLSLVMLALMGMVLSGPTQLQAWLVAAPVVVALIFCYLAIETLLVNMQKLRLLRSAR